jgi:hypothetical protein
VGDGENLKPFALDVGAFCIRMRDQCARTKISYFFATR